MTERQNKLWDYFILCARVLLAWTFISYGWDKLTGDQFGLRENELSAPVKDLSLFRLSWFLFDHEPFKSFIGISQIIAALLLLYNRTLLLGALLAIPLLANILVIDITYIKMPGFYWRLSYYLFLDFLILWHYRDRMLAAYHHLVNGLTSKFKYPIWAYLILPFMAIGLELLGLMPQVITGLITHPAETWEGLCKIPAMLANAFSKIGG